MRGIVTTLVVALGAVAAAGEGPRERPVRLTYSVRVAPPAGARQIDVWAPVPRDMAGQRVTDVAWTSSAGTASIADDEETGNRVCHLEVERPEAPIVLTLSCAVVAEAREPGAGEAGPVAPFDAPERHLGADRLVPVGGRFAELGRARTLGRGSTLERARALYEHVRGAMVYDKTGQGWGRGDADFACDVGRGNCTDYHSLFLALARSVGIPARFCIGLSLPPARGAGQLSGYHCWAEFWDDAARRWVPVDISEADRFPERAERCFGALDPDRVTLSRGRDLVLVPAQAGPPLNFFVQPHVECDGVPLEAGVELRVSYADE